MGDQGEIERKRREEGVCEGVIDTRTPESWPTLKKIRDRI